MTLLLMLIQELYDKQISQILKIIFQASSDKHYRFAHNIHMNKNFTAFFQHKSYKDPECATNTCTTDASYNNKSSSTKFARKQDVTLIEKKKKTTVDQTSLLCYLTPKHHEQSAKLIMQRIRDSCGQLGTDSLISQPSKQVTTKTSSGKFSFKGYEPYRPAQKRTSIEKRTSEHQNKFITVVKQAKQSADKSLTVKEPFTAQKDKNSGRFFRLSDNKKQDEKEGNEKSKVLSANYEKQLKKLKNQCQHYSNLLEVANKERIESQSQIKSLNALINQLKQKNTSLAKSSEELSREILQLSTKLSMLPQEKDKLTKENALISEEKSKLSEEVNYFKDTVNQLNERIELMLHTEKEIKLGQKSTNFISSQPTHSRRFNSSLVTPHSALELRQQSVEEQSRVMRELREELKYCQVEISMLKRVKMDINKKNEEFIKLQKQNKVLKNQLFDMKTGDFFDEPAVSRANNRSSARLHNESKPSQNNGRNNFQIGLKRGGRAADQKSDSLSSDTLSLNLSVSPQKNKHYSNTLRV